ncbi:MAG: type II secretion system protein [Planctomycetes bacterium]|nr:type II secretion system protein [Planctomycetota bacterium]
MIKLKQKDGLTLIELLIAISIFSFLCVLLAGLIKVSFDLWRGSERQGDVTDRRQIILETLRNDMESVYLEKETREVIKDIVGNKPLPDDISVKEPSFYTDIDQAGNHWVYLVRTDSDNMYEFSSGNIPSKRVIRVMYYIRTNASGKTTLCRSVLDKATAVKFFVDKEYISGSFPLSTQETLFEDVVYFGVKLVIDSSKTEKKWDSLPQDKDTLKPSSDENTLVVKQTLPPAIELEVVLKPSVFPEPYITLRTDNDNTLLVSNTNGLPAPSEYVKIDQEWIEFSGFSGNNIKVSQRGARNTAKADHPSGAFVIYGETLKQLLYFVTSGATATSP